MDMAFKEGVFGTKRVLEYWALPATPPPASSIEGLLAQIGGIPGFIILAGAGTVRYRCGLG